MSPKLIGYKEQVNGLVMLAESSGNYSEADFTIPSGYHTIEWHFYNVHPGVDNDHFEFQVNVVGGSGWNENLTTAFMWAYHPYGGGDTNVGIAAGFDNDGTTGFADLTVDQGDGSDESASGYMIMYDPHNTDHVTNFRSRINHYHSANYTIDQMVCGYVDATDAVDAIRFKFESGGNFDGTIRMYGAK